MRTEIKDNITMNFRDAVTGVTRVLLDAPTATFHISGKPGCGKSDLSRHVGRLIARAEGWDHLEKDRLKSFHLASHDVVDFSGLPSVVDGMTVFNPMAALAQFKEGTGPGVINLEELAQSDNDQQTFWAGVILDRQTTSFKLDPQVRIITTGNRVEDRAGARALLSHLSDRLFHIELDASEKDWVAWALEQPDITPTALSFIRYRPELLNTFDPNQRVNATQRSWTKLFTEVPDDLPEHIYFKVAAGKVGLQGAQEWCALRNMMDQMPDRDAVRMRSADYPIPDHLGIQYATVTNLAHTLEDETGEGFENDWKFISRFPSEFQFMYLGDVLVRYPHIQETNGFIRWTLSNQHILLNLPDHR